MSKQTEALKLALEALESCDEGDWSTGHVIHPSYDEDAVKQAMIAIEEALAQPEQEPVAKAMTAHRAAYFMERFKHEEKLLGPNEQAALDFVISMLEAQPAVTEQHKQEPVAWITNNGDGWLRWHRAKDNNSNSILFYTTPPQRTWVGLTDEDKKEYVAQDFGGNRLDAMDWAEKRLKEKNT